MARTSLWRTTAAGRVEPTNFRQRTAGLHQVADLPNGRATLFTPHRHWPDRIGPATRRAFDFSTRSSRSTLLLSQVGTDGLLILDDFGLSPLGGRARADLLEILDDRIGIGSTIVADQTPVKEWHGFINDPALADAILDRLIHSGHKLALKGESMRKVKASKA